MIPSTIVRRSTASLAKLARLPCKAAQISAPQSLFASTSQCMVKSESRSYHNSIFTSTKTAEKEDVDALANDLEKFQKDLEESSKAKQTQATAEGQDDDAALADMFKKQQAQMTGDEDILGGSKSDVLIEENERVAGPSSTMEFQAETRKLLDIVAKSLYSEKEVFVRELISNASDALEKSRFKRIGGETPVGDTHLKIMISADETKKTLTIQDTGIGMTRQELISDLGNIGHSGTGEYLKAMEKSGTGNLIGQFGVGFYATFMVASRIRVYSRSIKEPNAPGHVWESDGSGSYKIAPADNVAFGTKIVIELTPECEEFCKKATIENIVKKYSSFVGFDIFLNGSKINTIKALWLMDKSQVTEADHKEFYQFIAHAHDTPLYHLHYSADMPINIRSVFYIPESHMEKYGLGIMEPAISLYARKVLIQAKCKGLLPEWLRFMKGVVDSEDIPLNLSRELLQDSSLIKRLNSVLTRRILKFLDEESVRDETKYMKFYNEFNVFLKQGLCTDVKYKEELAKLLRMESSKSPAGVVTTFDKYIENMIPNQSEIYYLIVPNRTFAEASPYYEGFKKKGVEVLFGYNQIDDFVMTNLAEFKGKKLVSIESQNAVDAIKGLGETAKADEKPSHSLSDQAQSDLASWLKEVLSARVSSVIATDRLSSSPAVVVDHESAAFRRMMKMVDPGKPASIQKTQLQFNPSHPVIVKLNAIRESDAILAKEAAEQILDNCLIQAGLLDDPRSMIPRLNKLLEHALNSDESKKL